MVSGELTGPQRQAVLAHVEQCDHCRQRVAKLQDVWQAMDAWQVEAAGHEVADEVLQTLKARLARPQTSPWRQPWRWPVPLRAAASFMAAVGIGWGAARWTSQPTPADMAAGTGPDEPVTGELVARDIGLDVLTGGSATGLAVTFLDEQLQQLDEEEKG
jgi:anti-sigma factor RsiW